MAPSTQIPIFATPMSDFTDFCPIFAKIGHAATAGNLINSRIWVVVARRDRRGRDVLVTIVNILLTEFSHPSTVLRNRDPSESEFRNFANVRFSLKIGQSGKYQVLLLNTSVAVCRMQQHTQFLRIMPS